MDLKANKSERKQEIKTVAFILGSMTEIVFTNTLGKLKEKEQA